VQSPKKTTTVREGLRGKAGLAVEQPTQATIDKQAVVEGRKPLASRRKDLAALQAKAAELYGVPPDGLAAIPAIEKGFQFSPLASDAEFNYLDVESLLDQAAGLLECCAIARSQRDRLQLEKWKLQLELDHFFRLDQVQERERQAGADTLPYERAALESGAESALEANHRSAEAGLKELTDELVASGFNKRMAGQELAAWMSAYPLKDNDLRGDDANYTFDGVRRTKPEHLFEAARLEADEAAWELVSDLMARRFAAMAASEAGRLRKESLELRTKWSLAEIGFRGERSQAERDAHWEKVLQAQSSGGPLNYSEQISPIERQFSFDFREVLARLIAARRGLKELYDYEPPFPQEGTAGYFDDVTFWVRTGQTRIAQFSQLDQNYVLAISVKELAKSQGESSRSSQWTFDVSEELFEGQAHVRLRGVGMAVVGEKGGEKTLGLWSGRLSVPPTATVRLMSGATKELDQKSFPACYFGRVADRSSPREPEIAGVNTLRNASPIGKQWKLTLSPKSSEGTATASLHDVELYLHLAVRGLKSGD